MGRRCRGRVSAARAACILYAARAVSKLAMDPGLLGVRRIRLLLGSRLLDCAARGRLLLDARLLELRQWRLRLERRLLGSVGWILRRKLTTASATSEPASSAVSGRAAFSDYQHGHLVNVNRTVIHNTFVNRGVIHGHVVSRSRVSFNGGRRGHPRKPDTVPTRCAPACRRANRGPAYARSRGSARTRPARVGKSRTAENRRGAEAAANVRATQNTMHGTVGASAHHTESVARHGTVSAPSHHNAPVTAVHHSQVSSGTCTRAPTTGQHVPARRHERRACRRQRWYAR